MQDLHLVGLTPDHQGLVVSTRKGARSGGFVLPVDDDLYELILEARRGQRAEAEAGPPAVEEPPPRVESNLSVRAIQSWLRAGRSVETVAEAAGVDPGWIERFAPPVRAEQAQIVEQATNLPMTRSNGDVSARPLGACVRHVLAERGVVLGPDAFRAGWSARIAGDFWQVEFNYRHRGPKQAAWSYRTDTGEVQPLDGVATRLGFVTDEEAAAVDATVASTPVPPPGVKITPAASLRPRPASPRSPRDGGDSPATAPTPERSAADPVRPTGAPASGTAAGAAGRGATTGREPARPTPRPPEGPPTHPVIAVAPPAPRPADEAESDAWREPARASRPAPTPPTFDEPPPPDRPRPPLPVQEAPHLDHDRATRREADLASRLAALPGPDEQEVSAGRRDHPAGSNGSTARIRADRATPPDTGSTPAADHGRDGRDSNDGDGPAAPDQNGRDSRTGRRRRRLRAQ